MKGLQHKVIEINDTKNTQIEKILVFLKPGQERISIQKTRQEANDILENIYIGKKKKFKIPTLKTTLFFLGVSLLALGFLIIL